MGDYEFLCTMYGIIELLGVLEVSTSIHKPLVVFSQSLQRTKWTTTSGTEGDFEFCVLDGTP